MDNQERDLLTRYLEGDREALAELVERYRRPLYGFILRMMEGRGDADDIFQETWIRAIRKLPDFRVDNLLGWLFRIAHNLVIDAARRSARMPPAGKNAEHADGGAPDPPDRAPGPDRALQHKELGARVRACVADLPTEQREVFLLRTEAGLPFREIARIQRVGLNTALGRMHYAVARLRKVLQDEMETES